MTTENKLPTCTVSDCDSAVRVKEATEMPTMLSSDGTSKTVFDVKYCDNGHVLGYRDRQVVVDNS